MGNMYFNPGCALSIYKPHLEEKIFNYLNQDYGEVLLHKICCHHDPKLEKGSVIINVCPGCDRRFRSLYEGVSTISLWEVLDKIETFQFPNYHGMELSIHDACPTREKTEVHAAIRSLLKKMNIKAVESERHGTKAFCCGDNFYPELPVEQVHEHMKKRAASMPCEEVAVYCVSCVKSMYIGGKTPRYLVDLLFGEPTDPGTYDTVKWHEQVQAYIDTH